MKFINSLFILLSFVAISAACGSPQLNQNGAQDPPDHTAWTDLLQKYVDEKGFVNYKAFKNDMPALEAYLNTLENHYPSKDWRETEKLAYWINAYNAYTIKLILDHYPISGIKEIKKGIPFVNTVWDIKFIEIGGEKLDLNNIEHGIIRKEFDEPRIHFALVCAAKSCPKLRNEAYQADLLDTQLDEQAYYFINESAKNIISPKEAKLSKILDWYGGDFKSKGGVIKVINQYSKIKIGEDTRIRYLEYDWSLNEQ